MNLDKLKQILVDNKIFVSETIKNYICICPYCLDHPDPKKKGHLYISKSEDIPVGHCWFCNGAWPIPLIIKDLTGNKNLYREVISDEELKTSYKQIRTSTSKITEFKIPNIDENSFLEKKMYIRRRSGNKTKAEDVPNLVLDILNFFHINNLDIIGKGKILSDYEADMLSRSFVGFLGCNNSILYCRNIDSNSKFKFKKIPIQTNPLLLLDYWKIPMNNMGELVVMSEGNFDILGEYSFDSLGIKNRVKLYASGNTFSYGSLLKSICYNENLYKVDVIILSDDDKPAYYYKKFLQQNDHIIKTCKIYMNRAGKDFGVFPIIPTQIL